MYIACDRMRRLANQKHTKSDETDTHKLQGHTVTDTVHTAVQPCEPWAVTPPPDLAINKARAEKPIAYTQRGAPRGCNSPTRLSRVGSSLASFAVMKTYSVHLNLLV